jgi:glucokinase
MWSHLIVIGHDVINDRLFLFTNNFNAMEISSLTNEQKIQIGSGKPISVCGPYTGLGMATLVPVEGKWHCFF